MCERQQLKSDSGSQLFLLIAKSYQRERHSEVPPLINAPTHSKAAIRINRGGIFSASYHLKYFETKNGMYIVNNLTARTRYYHLYWCGSSACVCFFDPAPQISLIDTGWNCNTVSFN